VQSVTGEWLSLLLRIWESRVQISTRRLAIMAEVFVVSSVLPGKCVDSSLP
jgi:hypothetical protein